MYEDEKHPRANDGKYAPKTGTAPSIGLDDEGYDNFDLVQPLERRDWDAGKPGMQVYHMPYMGATEYETGGQRKSLIRLRSRDEAPETAEHEITMDDGSTRTVYFVGQNLEANIAQFERWVEDGAHSQEPSHFRGILGQGSDYAQERAQETAAWWAFEGDVLFTMDPAERDRIIEAIADVPADGAQPEKKDSLPEG
jgi:hypothetical protein